MSPVTDFALPSLPLWADGQNRVVGLLFKEGSECPTAIILSLDHPRTSVHVQLSNAYDDLVASNPVSM